LGPRILGLVSFLVLVSHMSMSVSVTVSVSVSVFVCLSVRPSVCLSVCVLVYCLVAVDYGIALLCCLMRQRVAGT
jgi:hypothetical protein